MNLIKQGDIVSIHHYSGINPFKSVVMEINSDTILLKLAKEFAVMNFLEGDPVVLGLERGDEIIIIGCNISEIRPKQDIIELKIDKLDEGSEKRQWERYPVSIYADIRTKNCRKKSIATIKDLSCYGMLIYSKTDFPLHEQLEIDIYMEKTMIFLKTNIARKVQSKNYFEYGLGILYEDSNSLNYMKDYLKKLRQEQVESIRKLKNK